MRARDSPNLPKTEQTNLVFFFCFTVRILETWNRNFKFQVSPDCHGKKPPNSFVRFLGESMVWQSAFSFIWSLEACLIVNWKIIFKMCHWTLIWVGANRVWQSYLFLVERVGMVLHFSPNILESNDGSK